MAQYRGKSLGYENDWTGLFIAVYTGTPPSLFTNNQSAFKHQAFVSNETQRLLETGCIREVEREETHIISQLSVVDNGGKLRLISDLIYLNSFMSVPKFKYENVRTIRYWFNKGDFFFKIWHKT